MHADLESVYVLPKAPCQPYQPDYANLCKAQTIVYVLPPTDYADCLALVTAKQLYGWCLGTDVVVDANLAWVPGGCASSAGGGYYVKTFAQLWAEGSGGYTSAPTTCSTIDVAYTQNVSLPSCPGTTFQVTAEIKGNADGSFTGGYKVNGSGTCAGAFDILVVEGSEW